LQKGKNGKPDTDDKARHSDHGQHKKIVVKIAKVHKPDDGKSKTADQENNTDNAKNYFCEFMRIAVHNKAP
jgi:hypothetical protein